MFFESDVAFAQEMHIKIFGTNQRYHRFLLLSAFYVDTNITYTVVYTNIHSRFYIVCISIFVSTSSPPPVSIVVFVAVIKESGFLRE